MERDIQKMVTRAADTMVFVWYKRCTFDYEQKTVETQTSGRSMVDAGT